MGVLDYSFGCADALFFWPETQNQKLSMIKQDNPDGIMYFNNYPNDSAVRRALVIASLFFSVLGLIGAYVDVYQPMVTFWGDPAALVTEAWSVPLYSAANAAQAAAVNGYLISRFYSVSKNLVVTLLLCFNVLFAFVAQFLAVLLFPGITNLGKAKIVAYIWNVSAVTSDVGIAVSLVWTLQGMKTNFKDTNRLVRRVMIISIQNGCATSLCAIAGLFATIFKIESNLSTLFLFMLNPLYVLTLLSNFNLRGSATSGSRTWSSSRNHGANSSIVINGIHVQRSAVVVVDPTTSDIEMSGSTKLQEDASAYSNGESVPAQNFSST
ncbi:hypothetical protein K438DRAFT_1959318 [Mycena galopus ATCC 62051]|nr:hypothetical protein K438DRAFT_1959318 [Mycena galopus ATCC 62051]